MNSTSDHINGHLKFKIIFGLCCVAFVSFFFIDRFRDSYCVVTDGESYFVQHKYGIIGDYIHLQAYPDYQSAKDSIGVVWNPKPKTYTEVKEPVTNYAVALSVKSIEDLYLCKATNLPTITSHLPVDQSGIQPINCTNLTNVEVKFTTNNCEAEAFNRIRMQTTLNTNLTVQHYAGIQFRHLLSVRMDSDQHPIGITVESLNGSTASYTITNDSNGVVSLERITE